MISWLLLENKCGSSTTIKMKSMASGDPPNKKRKKSTVSPTDNSLSDVKRYFPSVADKRLPQFLHPEVPTPTIDESLYSTVKLKDVIDSSGTMFTPANEPMRLFSEYHKQMDVITQMYQPRNNPNNTHFDSEREPSEKSSDKKRTYALSDTLRSDTPPPSALVPDTKSHLLSSLILYDHLKYYQRKY